MTIDEVKNIIKQEYECINRNDGVNCDRKCENCDLVLPVEDIKEAYNIVIKMFETDNEERYRKAKRFKRKYLKLKKSMSIVKKEFEDYIDSDAYGDYQLGENNGMRQALNIFNKYLEE